MDYFTHVCVGFPKGNLADKLKSIIRKYDEEVDDGLSKKTVSRIEDMKRADEPSPCVDIVEGKTEVFFEGDSVNIETFAELIYLAMKEQKDPGVVMFQYANTSNKSHVDAYGGGAVLVTSKKVIHKNTFDYISEWEQKYDKHE